MIIEQLFKESVYDEELKNYLLDFILYRFEEHDSWNLDYPLQELAYEIIKDTSYNFIQLFKNKSLSDFNNLKKYHLDKLKEYEDTVLSIVSEMEKIIETLKNQKEIWYGGNYGLPHKIKKLKNIRNLTFDKITKILQFLESKKYFKTNHQEITEQIFNKYLKLNQILEIKNWKTYKTHWFAYKSLQTSALISKLWEIGEKIKEENKFILMSDIHIKIKNFLENEPPEYLYWRLGNRYHYFLIDEFQDTSETQYFNLKPLIETVITTKPLEASALFVGDVKQSIYRWRGSQPSLLQNLKHDQIFKNYSRRCLF